ncbi:MULTISPECIES: ATP-binding protein [Micrococcaceae]|uniref:ATP-binding protein n=1 Tax=Micrococcaceae TaxID=1268 RepID=UPI00105E0B8E|nr:ATP-binding protein [Arthrobacter sp. JUb115]TDU30256.1 signal transduction histidine kinase [Arthrobacter sp. JUb115]
MADIHEHQGSTVSARLRIVGWIVLTTALALLAVTVSMRSIMSGQVAEAANVGIAQEIEEFRTFAAEGLDPKTARPFSSIGELMERYLARQQPMAGEAILAQANGRVLTAGTAANQAGTWLADDPVLLGRILDDAKTSGILESNHGTVRWAKAEAKDASGASGAGHQAHLVVAHFIGGAQEEANRQATMLFGVAAGGLALTAGIAWLAAGQIMRPIRTMSETAASISANDLSARVPVEGRDDLAQLARTLNAMLDRVEASHLAQRHFIAEAREHLGSPQRKMAAALQKLNEEEVPRKQRGRIISTAQAHISLMGQTLADLELLAQSSDPDFIQRRMVPVGEVTADVAAAAARPGAYPDRRFRIAESAKAQAWLDPLRVAQAMHQLIQNAVAHTEDGESIRIGSAAAKGMASFWVANDGPALDPDQARALLENYRSAPEAGQQGSGMGLGLAVVKAVAQAHGGTAWVESGNGNGTSFGFSLPQADAGQGIRCEEEFAQSMASSLGGES